MFDEKMTLADFEIPFSDVNMEDLVNSIPASIKSKTWQEMEQDRHQEHQEDIQ